MSAAPQPRLTVASSGSGGIVAFHSSQPWRMSAEEDALFAADLCSDAAACFVGQVFPVSGGWAME